jgi:amino acid adenylation domain-containing protein/thioester reductase-like protein
LVGDIQKPLFEQAWQQAVERHPVLRTAFVWEGLNEPLQIVNREVKLPWIYQDWRGLCSVEQEERLEVFLEADRKQGFQLDQVPLMRCALIQVAEHTFQFVWTHHHLLLDGWSLAILLQEIFDFYEAFRRSEQLTRERPRPYRDYIAWLKKAGGDAAAFWKKRLQGFLAPTPFGVDRTSGDPTLQETVYDLRETQLSWETTAALQSLAQRRHLTLSTLVQGAWALLLSRYSGDDDVVFGVTVSGRPPGLPGVGAMVGLFINTIPVRVQVSTETSLLSWLEQLQAQQVECEPYIYSPLVDIQGWSDVPRRLPLFESLVIFENYPVDTSLQKKPGSLAVSQVRVFDRTNYPLTVVASTGPELNLQIAYACSRFEADTIERMLKHLQNLLEGMAAHPENSLQELTLLTAFERQLLLTWNQTQRAYRAEACIHTLFEEQVEKTPEALAVVSDPYCLSYSELNRRANQLAHYLRQHGIGAESLVGLCVERSPDMMIGLLGILKAGAAYVPLDPAYPQERLGFMLEDAGLSFLITQQPFLAKLSENGASQLTTLPLLCLDSEAEVLATACSENPILKTTGHNVAYVIYTSGSTGLPKGVMIEHSSLVNYTEAAVEAYGLESRDRVLQFASLSFDASAEEIFPTLVCGGTLLLHDDATLDAGSTFSRGCEEQGVTVLNLPTAYWNEWVIALQQGVPFPSPVRLVIIGGERALPKKLAAWNTHVGRHVRLVNTYGPTEGTIVATHFDASQDRDWDTRREIPLGRPVANVQAVVMDPNRQLCPVGVPGELYLAGKGLARGYLNRPELTAEKFIHCQLGELRGKRLYRTGDRVRILPDGNLEFLGRADNQVKLNGHRIELGEIEAVLTQHASVSQTVVTLREDVPGDKRLAAYIVANGASPFRIEELRRFLRRTLPDYMMPSVFVRVEALPVTPHGKVNRLALPIPESSERELDVAFVGPRTPVEEVLARIWAELLGKDKVSILDNFIALGGHSLQALKVISRVREAFSVQLPVRCLYESPTVAGMAQAIELAYRDGTFDALATHPPIDLQEEAVLDPTIQAETAPSVYVAEPDSIFLTGATGFLGVYLLHDLLQKTGADIYCLIRSTDVAESKRKIQRQMETHSLWNESLSSRIIPVPGDLSLPLLGLSEQQFRHMATQIDVIYHSGAWVNFIHPYRLLKTANVLGTQEVLRLAFQTKSKPVHYISTLSVFASPAYSKVKVFRESDPLDDSVGLEDGYTQSKWVMEKLMMKARDRGLPVCIYRPGRLTGHSKTGVANTDDLLCRLIKGCIQLGMAPSLDLTVDMTPVDYVSQAIVHLSRQKESFNKVFHLSNPHPLPLTVLIHWVRTEGYPLEPVSYDKWLAELKRDAEHSEENALYPLLHLFSEMMTSEIKSETEPSFDDQNTRHGLDGSNIVCPPVDSELLSTYFSYFRSCGFLTAPQRGIEGVFKKEIGRRL